MWYTWLVAITGWYRYDRLTATFVLCVCENLVSFLPRWGINFMLRHLNGIVAIFFVEKKICYKNIFASHVHHTFSGAQLWKSSHGLGLPCLVFLSVFIIMANICLPFRDKFNMTKKMENIYILVICGLSTEANFVLIRSMWYAYWLPTKRNISKGVFCFEGYLHGSVPCALLACTCMFRVKEGRYFNWSTHSICLFSCHHAVSLWFQWKDSFIHFKDSTCSLRPCEFNAFIIEASLSISHDQGKITQHPHVPSRPYLTFYILTAWSIFTISIFKRVRSDSTFLKQLCL